MRFVDVGQGDGAVVETPGGQVLFLDGGEELHMTRYVRRAFGHILADEHVHGSCVARGDLFSQSTGAQGRHLTAMGTGTQIHGETFAELRASVTPRAVLVEE